ncbi:MAG: FtsH protease activity modulator HflK [Desulfomonile tiedjei]|nr:FtsH protease activity modulator HflK [Desulfomonile tiedjei]
MDQFRPRDDQNPVREIQRGVEDIKAMLNNFLKGRATWLIILLIVILYLASGVYIVGAGEKGVVLMFGKLHSLTDPGLRYRLPKPFMSHQIVDIATVRRVEVGYRSDKNRTRPVPAESLMLTGDENIVDLQLFVQYMVQDPVKFLFGAEHPESALRASAEVALRGVVGEKTIDDTMTTGRTEIQKKVESYLQRLLDTYNTGLLVTQARLLEADAPTQVREAFHDVVRAWEDRDRLIKEADGYREDVIPKARGQAQQEIREAEAYKAQRVIRAKGDAERFTAVSGAYEQSPDVTRERLYLEGAESFLQAAKKFIMEGGKSGILPILPLKGLQEPSVSTRPGTKASESPAEKKGN